MCTQIKDTHQSLSAKIYNFKHKLSINSTCNCMRKSFKKFLSSKSGILNQSLVSRTRQYIHIGVYLSKQSYNPNQGSQVFNFFFFCFPFLFQLNFQGLVRSHHQATGILAFICKRLSLDFFNSLLSFSFFFKLQQYGVCYEF